MSGLFHPMRWWFPLAILLVRSCVCRCRSWLFVEQIVFGQYFEFPSLGIRHPLGGFPLGFVGYPCLDFGDVPTSDPALLLRLLALLFGFDLYKPSLDALWCAYLNQEVHKVAVGLVVDGTHVRNHHFFGCPTQNIRAAVAVLHKLAFPHTSVGDLGGIAYVFGGVLWLKNAFVCHT